MGLIKDSNKYPYKTTLVDDDYTIGSDSAENGKTKSFKLSDIKTYVGTGGAVSSVFGRTGTVVAQSGDYEESEISNKVEYIVIPCSDETSNLSTGTGKATFAMPFAATITGVIATVNTAPTGSNLIVDINEAGTTILSTKLTIDAGETSSTTAATPAVISDNAIAQNAIVSVDIDQVGATIPGAGLKITLICTR